jgi:hypothetical protein
MKEGRRASVLQNSLPEHSEPLADDNLEEMILLEDFLRQARRAGVLSPNQYKLLLKFKYEGFRWKELADGDDGPSAIALYYRVQRTLNRLRRSKNLLEGKCVAPRTHALSSSPERNISREALDFSGEVPFSNSEKRFSPELSRPVPQVGSDRAQVAACRGETSKSPTDLTAAGAGAIPSTSVADPAPVFVASVSTLRFATTNGEKAYGPIDQ